MNKMNSVELSSAREDARNTILKRITDKTNELEGVQKLRKRNRTPPDSEESDKDQDKYTFDTFVDDDSAIKISLVVTSTLVLIYFFFF